MKKISKRVLAMFLAVLMLMCSVPMSVVAESNTYKRGDIIEFGSYPQTEVTDKDLIEKLNSQDLVWDSFGWGVLKDDISGYDDFAHYADIFYQGNKYRGIIFSVYRSGFQKTNGYVSNTIHWFKYENIKWKVLDPVTGLVISDSVLDAESYVKEYYKHNGYYYNSADFSHRASDYPTSYLRAWMNSTFLDTAFTATQKTILNNRAFSSDVSDKVFTIYDNEKDVYYAYGTDYAKACGLFVDNNGSSGWYLYGDTIDESAASYAKISGYNGYGFGSVWKDWWGVRPAIVLDLEKYNNLNNYSVEATAYIQQHIDFTKSSKYAKLLSNGSFYNSIWKYELTDKNFTAMTAWKVLGDIGGAMSLNFKNLLITENPYDIILADILSSYVADNTIIEASEKTLETVFNIDDAYNDIIKTLQTSEEWDKTADISELKDVLGIILGKSKKSLIDGVFFSKKEYDIKEKHPGVYSYLSKLISKIPQDKWNGIFKGIDNTSTVLGYINTASDIVYSFVDAYQKYVVAKALVTTQTNALSSLMLAGYYMPPIAQNLLQESLNSYLEVLNYDSGFNAVCNYALGDSIESVYGVFRGSLTNLFYNLIGKVFNIKNIGSVGAVVFTYNTTYAILDYFSGLGDRSELFFLLDSAAYLEQGLVETVSNHADTLNDKKTLDCAENFDSAWGLLQALEQYAFCGLGKYISAIKRCYGFETTLKTALSGKNYFYIAIELKRLLSNLSNADAGIQAAEYFEVEWRNSSCHDRNSLQSKVVSVKCPTDVYVYDENNNLALSIVSNSITKQDAQISALVDGNEKIFAIPDDQKYNIKIVGTDNGTMNYSIFDLEDMKTTSVSEYQNIALTPNCIYTGTLDIISENEETDYELSLDYYEPPHEHSYTYEEIAPTCTKDGKIKYTCSCGDTYTEILSATGHADSDADGKCDNCGEDFTKSCKHFCHSSNKFIQFIYKICRFLWKIFGINKYCACGKAHY